MKPEHTESVTSKLRVIKMQTGRLGKETRWLQGHSDDTNHRSSHLVTTTVTQRTSETHLNNQNFFFFFLSFEFSINQVQTFSDDRDRNPISVIVRGGTTALFFHLTICMKVTEVESGDSFNPPLTTSVCNTSRSFLCNTFQNLSRWSAGHGSLCGRQL